MTNKNISEIAKEALRDMYDEAEPSIDFDEILDNPGEQPDGWFKDYYLDSERQREIVDKYVEENNLSASEEMRLTWMTVVDYGPTSIRRED